MRLYACVTAVPQGVKPGTCMRLSDSAFLDHDDSGVSDNLHGQPIDLVVAKLDIGGS